MTSQQEAVAVLPVGQRVVSIARLVEYQTYKWRGESNRMQFLAVFVVMLSVPAGILVVLTPMSSDGSHEPTRVLWALCLGLALLLDSARRLTGARSAYWAFDELEASLPISANRWALARMLAFTLRQSVVLVAIVVAMLAMAWLTGRRDLRLAKVLFSLAGGAAGGYFLAAAVSQLVFRQHRRLVVKIAAALITAVLVGAGLWFWWFGVLAATAGLLFVALTYTRTPSAISVEPEFATEAAAQTASSSQKLLSSALRTPWLALARLEWVQLALIPLAGLYLSTVMYEQGRATVRLALQTHLPISRGRLLHQALLAPLALRLLGALVFVLVLRSMPFKAIEFDCRPGPQGEMCQLEVPWTWWQLGQPKAVVAPDGESWRPTAYAVGPDFLWTVHNPYETGPQEGTEFISLQLSRALADRLDLHLTPRQVQERYLSSEGWRSGLRVKDFPELASDPKSHVAAYLSLLLLALLCSAVFGFENGRPAATRLQRVGKIVQVTIGVPLVAILLIGWWAVPWLLVPSVSLATRLASMSSSISHWVISIQVLCYQYYRLWLSHPILTAAVVLGICFALWAALSWRFARMEVPPKWVPNLRRFISHV